MIPASQLTESIGSFPLHAPAQLKPPVQLAFSTISLGALMVNLNATHAEVEMVQISLHHQGLLLKRQGGTETISYCDMESVELATIGGVGKTPYLLLDLRPVGWHKILRFSTRNLEPMGMNPELSISRDMLLYLARTASSKFASLARSTMLPGTLAPYPVFASVAEYQRVVYG